MAQLEIPSPDASPEEVLKFLVTNSKNSQEGFDRLGINLLVSKVSRVAQAISTTSYTKLNEWQFGFRSSGGLIGVFFNPTLVQGGNELFLKLELDGTLEREVLSVQASGISLSTCVVLFKLLSAGDHTLKIFAKVNTGSNNVGAANSDSACYVVEFLKG